MSLISEALKKARLEAQKQDGRLPYHTRPTPPRPRSSPWPWVAAISVGLALGVVLGVALLGRSSSGESAAAASAVRETRPVTESPLPAAEPDGRDPEAGPEDPPADPETSGPVRPARVEAPSVAVEPPRPAESAAPPPVRTAVDATPRSASPTTAGSPASPRDGSGPSGPRDGESYLQRVALPGGGEIALRGIAWHATEPSALLNDRVLAVGDGLDDWTLVAVEPGRVAIEWRGIRFHVRLK